jgi:DNA topoisomerase-1
MKVYIEGKDDANGDKEESLPVLTENEKLKLLDTVSEQHFTQPPPRYTEARLVKTMEELGIGRPSTYAPTLDTIQKRGYVRLDQKRFVPTELGKLVNEMIEEFFANQIKIEFTAELEEKLDLVETGELNWEKLLREFYVGFEADLKAAEEEMKDVELKDEVSDEICEKCGRPMVYKLSRYGKFLGCSGFPECRNIKSIVNKIDVPCPKCGSDIIVRKGKKKSFYGCSAYPNCDYISFDKPVSRPCPSCNNMMVEKYRKSGNVIKCTECDYTEEMI